MEGIEGFDEDREQVQLQAEQLAHVKDRLERMTEAIAGANRLGFERGTPEHIEMALLLCGEYGVEPEVIEGLGELFNKRDREKYNRAPQQGPEIQENQQ